MSSAFLIIFSLLSLFGAVAVVYLYCRRTRPRRNLGGAGVTTHIQFVTCVVFVATFLAFLPVTYLNFPFEDGFHAFRNIPVALYSAIRTFIVEGDFALVNGALNGEPAWVSFIVSAVFVIYTVIAPILTLANVLSLLSYLFNAYRYNIFNARPTFIMSELNDFSISMAESIYEKYKDKRHLIIFTDVFVQNEEENYELMKRVRAIKAICLKNDITTISLDCKKNSVEIFLIGENETENIEHAIKLTEKINNILQRRSSPSADDASKWENNSFSVFLYASSAGAEYISDSIYKGENTTNEVFKKYVEENTEKMLTDQNWMDDAADKVRFKGKFYFRRLNPVKNLVMSVLDDKVPYKRIREACAEDKTISVTIVGMGSYGFEFLKNAVWFYQRYGYKVEINAFDMASTEGEGNFESVLRQQAPELLSPKTNPSVAEGDAAYDIRCFPGVDCFSSEFSDIFLEGDMNERLKRTKLVFVALGDDDRNIEAAIMMRRIFDRMFKVSKNAVNAKDLYEIPLIYSVVYDDKKASSLTDARYEDRISTDFVANEHIKPETKFLRSYSAQPFNINFVGAFSKLYSYSMIELEYEYERDAFKEHIGWINSVELVRKEYNDNPDFRAEYEKNLKEEAERKGETFGEVPWGDSKYYTDSKCTKGNSVELLKEVKKYAEYEYFRHSSKAKAVHKKYAMEHYGNRIKGHKYTCTCDDCNEMRITEHMRWNAYMRAIGYIYGCKNERAKMHPDLVVWSELDYAERFKD